MDEDITYIPASRIRDSAVRIHYMYYGQSNTIDIDVNYTTPPYTAPVFRIILGRKSDVLWMDELWALSILVSAGSLKNPRSHSAID